MTTKRAFGACVVFTMGYLGSAGLCHAQAALSEARVLVESGDYQKAIATLQSYEETASNESEAAVAANALGWTYFTAGRSQEAETTLSRALRRARAAGDSETATRAANNLGIVYFVDDRLDAALEQFALPESRDSEVAATYRRIIEQKKIVLKADEHTEAAVARRRESDFEGAIAEYDEALKLQPGNARALAYKGYALYRQRDYEEALRVLQEALRADPSRTLVTAEHR